MATKSKPPESDDTGQKRQRWKFQMYVPKDPEQPELGETRLTHGGFKNLDEA